MVMEVGNRGNSTLGNILSELGSLWLNNFLIFSDHNVLETEENVTIEEVSDSHLENVNSPPRIKKRKHAEPQLWKKNQRKRNRDTGKSYINTRGVVVAAKKIQADYCCGCPKNCSNKISFEQRLSNFN